MTDTEYQIEKESAVILEELHGITPISMLRSSQFIFANTHFKTDMTPSELLVSDFVEEENLDQVRYLAESANKNSAYSWKQRAELRELCGKFEIVPLIAEN